MINSKITAEIRRVIARRRVRVRLYQWRAVS